MNVATAQRRLERLSKHNAVVIRCLSAVALGVPVLAIVYFGSPYYEVMIIVAGVLLAREWCRLCAERPSVVAMAMLGASIAAAVVALVWSGWPLALTVLAAVALALYATTGGRAWIGGGALYVGLPCLAMVWLRGEDVGGRDMILWLLLVVWASDIGAYAVGRLVGGPRLAPRVSPKKTWAGLIGGLVFAAIVGAVMVSIFDGSDVWPVAATSVVLGALAQLGDLFESGVKRRFGVKDSGTLIPGHGGLLDRVDGLMVACVGLALIVAIGDGRIGSWI